MRCWWAAVLVGACAALPAWALPSFEQVRADYRPSEVELLSREGEVLQRLRVDANVRRGAWQALADVSPALRQALLLSEDQRFYAHSGVDWTAVSAAAWGRLWHQRTRGASTITMQLAGLLDEDLRRGSGGRSAVQKVGQALAAQQLERQWRKDQILEAYLNLVPFRGEVVGIEALARTLFGKAAHGLDAQEAAVAAALVRAPNARAAQVAQRACGVLRALQPTPVPDCLALDMFASAALQRRAWAASEGVAPHFARQQLARAQAALAPGQALAPRLASTLRAPLQRFAVQTLAQQLRELRGRGVEDGAIVVLDNASGELLAWVGSSGALSQAAEVDAVLARRQPGSTLKPFLYAQALAERRLTAASLLHDAPAQIATASGLYIPQNYDRQFKGWVSARTALAASLNVPAVRTLVMVTPEAFATQLQALGVPLAQTGGYYGYSLALGSSEVDLLHLANAYRALANGGRASAPAWQRGQRPQFTPALDARAAFIVGDILSDPLARARTFGTDSVLATRFWTAVKTGTSKDMRDNWALGWSARYTVGVWVGNASGAAMHDVSGSSGAAPIWAAVMQFLHRLQPSQAPLPPAGLQLQAVRFGADAQGRALEAARREWFLAGTGQALFAIDSGAVDAVSASASSQNNAQPRIVAPTPGSIIALDPDIPPAHQRLWFEAQGSGGAALRWRIDGRIAGRGARWAWLPWPGRHHIELLDASGQVQDSLRLEVRGAGVAAAKARP
jgi:penicillin-binding protein 1C